MTIEKSYWQCVMSHTNTEASEWVTPHVWMSHVARMNESCHTYEWVMSHIRMQSLLAGFHSLIPPWKVNGFTTNEFEAIMCGQPEISDLDVEQLRAFCISLSRCWATSCVFDNMHTLHADTYTYLHLHKYIYKYSGLDVEQLGEFFIICIHYRATKTHRMPALHRSFSAKELYN